MNQQTATDATALWRQLVDSEMAYSRAWMEFFAAGVDRLPVVRNALRGKDRFRTALKVVPYLTVPERQQLFGELVAMARTAHGPVGAVRDIICSLPRDWVLAHIEKEVEPILREEQYEDYWMFLELYEQLDRELTLKLARRAAAHPDPDIREKGEDLLEKLLGVPTQRVENQP